mgnify:CR=1 FL=1
MTPSPSSRSYAKAVYSPSQQKTLANLLKRELVCNFGFDNKVKIAEVLIETMLDIIDRYGQDREQLHPHQVLWPAVDKDEYPSYGKTMAQTKHHTVILTLWTPEELEQLAEGTPPRRLLPARIARLCQEAWAQDTVLSMIDVGLLLNISPRYAGQKRQEWEEANHHILKTRGSWHDMGLTFTHKRQIIADHLQGMMPSEIARKQRHEINAVDRYIRDFERVLPLFQEQQPLHKIAFYTRMSERLVQEYHQLYLEYYPPSQEETRTESREDTQ